MLFRSDMFITPYGAPHVAMEKEGKIKFVAALSEKPQRLIAQVRSVDEAPELKRFYYSIGSGYYVKKDTPEPIVEALNKALAKVMFDSELRSTLIAMGQELATPLRLDDAAKVYADEIRLYQGIARAINLQAQ